MSTSKLYYVMRVVIDVESFRSHCYGRHALRCQTRLRVFFSFLFARRRFYRVENRKWKKNIKKTTKQSNKQNKNKKNKRPNFICLKNGVLNTKVYNKKGYWLCTAIYALVRSQSDIAFLKTDNITNQNSPIYGSTDSITCIHVCSLILLMLCLVF